MKYIVVFATILVIGWLAYTRVMASPPELQTCQQIEMLCGEMTLENMTSCQSDLRDTESMLGEGTTGQIQGCVEKSASCGDAVACMTSKIGRSKASGLFQVPGSENSSEAASEGSPDESEQAEESQPVEPAQPTSVQ